MNKNSPSQRYIVIFLLIIFFCWNSISALAYPITPTGKKLDVFLNELDVANHWLPHREVDWQTGKTLGSCSTQGTHCSTFVAAAATKLGVYILRPPDHEQMLANAQYYWLRNRGASYGWAAVDDYVLAQRIANQGCLVVIAYANPNGSRPGHVAIVRPSAKSKEEINSKGPQIIQAGGKNFNSTSLSKGFRRHRTAFQKKNIVYYAHSTPFCQLLANKEDRGQSATIRL